MILPIYQVDAFTDKLFGGNPAAVCPMDTWPEDEIMQSIAIENNLAETAFLVKEPDGYRIRWFTPVLEVDLCGHATLGTGHVVFEFLHPELEEISFQSRSGILTVKKQSDTLLMDFPADTLHRLNYATELPETIRDAFSNPPMEAWKGATDYLLIYKNESDIRTLDPDFRMLKSAPGRGVIVSAPGDHVDFVSRFFAPQAGVDEDPVTGSAHTTLTPYWASRLGKIKLNARQISPRGGTLSCELKGGRVLIGGKTVLYMKGEIIIE